MASEEELQSWHLCLLAPLPPTVPLPKKEAHRVLQTTHRSSSEAHRPLSKSSLERLTSYTPVPCPSRTSARHAPLGYQVSNALYGHRAYLIPFIISFIISQKRTPNQSETQSSREETPESHSNPLFPSSTRDQTTGNRYVCNTWMVTLGTWVIRPPPPLTHVCPRLMLA